MRQAFYQATTELLRSDPRAALVLADISVDAMSGAARAHPDRVLNVGIREQLMVSVAGGLALTGLRPIAHSYAPFLVERAWEQIKLDLGHQGVGAVLVSVGASYDEPGAGRTHFAPGDVAMLDTLDGWTVHVPGHPAEVGPLLRSAASGDEPVYLRLAKQHNAHAYHGGGLVPLRRGRLGVIIAIGPMLDRVLAAAEGLDVTVAYTHTPRPFDGEALRALLWESSTSDVVLVEPYLAGTSAHVVSQALASRSHRLISLGVGRMDLRRYGTVAEHDAAHALDVPGLRRSILAALQLTPQ